MKILSIIRFGSFARKDNDEYSDIDICIFVDKYETKEEVIEKASKLIYNNNVSNTDFIIHNEEAFTFMLERGSLFLWHLNLECTPSFGKEYFTKKMSSLKKFNNYENKFNDYLNLFYDLKDARKNLPISSLFDFSILFTVVRNLCILVCYKINQPKFGRRSAFYLFIKKFPNSPLSKSDYENLMTYKLNYERGINLEAKTDLDINSYISKMDSFIPFVKKILEIEG